MVELTLLEKKIKLLEKMLVESTVQIQNKNSESLKEIRDALQSARKKRKCIRDNRKHCQSPEL